MRYKLTIESDYDFSKAGEPQCETRLEISAPTFEMLTEKVGAWERANKKYPDAVERFEAEQQEDPGPPYNGEGV